jgi:monovalent cation:H+ antiporter, CPA1 family
MELLTIITALIFINTTFSYLNKRFIKFPSAIGVMVISIVVSMVVLVLGRTGSEKSNIITNLEKSIDFSSLLLNVMLGLLLFAMAVHFDYKKLKQLRLSVILLSTLGVFLSAGYLRFYFIGWRRRKATE